MPSVMICATNFSEGDLFGRHISGTWNAYQVVSTTKHNQKPEDILKKPLGNGSSNKNFYSKNQISDLNFPKSLKKYRKILNAGVRFAVSCCQLLETVIFNETILALLPVESKANILYVNIYIFYCKFDFWIRYILRSSTSRTCCSWALALRKFYFNIFFIMNFSKWR